MLGVCSLSSDKKDIRWMQRLQNFELAFTQMTRFLENKSLNAMEEQGLIQCFEYNYELAWNVIKDFFQNQGVDNILCSKDAFRLAFNRGLLEDGQLWMDMVECRKLTSHTYNTLTAKKVLFDIRARFYPAFKKLLTDLKARQEE